MNLRLLFNTIRNLKIKQLRYQIFYRLSAVKTINLYVQDNDLDSPDFLSFTDCPPMINCAYENNTFTFLNRTVHFKKAIDWSYSSDGKLWNYNLQYANFLLQENISLSKRLDWLDSLHLALYNRQIKLEPYPTSLRIINTIRLLSKHQIDNKNIIDILNAQLNFLSKRIEYHLLGNHILENGFALLMGGVFLKNQALVRQASNILRSELSEQILTDGAHFELSTMYHQIILFRVLELVDWYSNWNNKDTELLDFFKEKAILMLSWLQNISFSNGEIPYLNDGNAGITYSTTYLLTYGRILGLRAAAAIKLSQSGYRAYKGVFYECIVDAAEIGASYLPGHGHADALSFILHYNNLPVFVEAATSTYQAGIIRDYERSTSAHNTVTVNNINQSQIWGAFKVGNRANVKILFETKETMVTEHDGYLKDLGLIHRRNFLFDKHQVVIKDKVYGKIKPQCVAFFHLHPDTQPELENNSLKIKDIGIVMFNNYTKTELGNYNFAVGFNKRVLSKVLYVSFVNELETIISFDS